MVTSKSTSTSSISSEGRSLGRSAKKIRNMGDSMMIQKPVEISTITPYYFCLYNVIQLLVNKLHQKAYKERLWMRKLRPLEE